jgi:hypothetical protein
VEDVIFQGAVQLPVTVGQLDTEYPIGGDRRQERVVRATPEVVPGV